MGVPFGIVSTEVRMKRFLLVLSLLCLTLISSTAFADHIYLIPNDGSGDNFGFVGQMNGHQLLLSGGTPYDFFGTGGYAPGSIFGGGATLFLYPAVVWIGGLPLEFGFPQSDSIIFISSFTLPTNGKDFTKFVEIGFSAMGRSFDTGQTIAVGGGAAGKMFFYFSPDSGLYYPGAFVQAPEPSTVGFIGIGIVGILGSARKRLKRTKDVIPSALR
jgi:hypothetical protein